MKKTMEWILSAALIAAVSSACTSTKEKNTPDTDPYQQAELHMAINQDIDAQMNAYVEPYDDVMPVYSSAMAGKLFAGIPEFALLEENGRISGEYKTMDGTVSFLFSMEPEQDLKLETKGAPDYNQEAMADLLKQLALIIRKPLTSVSSVNLMGQEMTGLNKELVFVPMEVSLGGIKCYPLVCSPKYGTGEVVFYVSTEDNNLQKITVRDAAGTEICSFGSFNETGFPGTINTVVEGKSKLLVLQN